MTRKRWFAALIALFILLIGMFKDFAVQLAANLAARHIQQYEEQIPTASPIPTLPPTLLAPTVLVPIDQNGNPLVAYTPDATHCAIYVKQSTQGINIYPDINRTFDGYEIGYLLATDGIISVMALIWGDGPNGKKYRWASITVRGITGLVHADPPWAAESVSC